MAVYRKIIWTHWSRSTFFYLIPDFPLPLPPLRWRQPWNCLFAGILSSLICTVLSRTIFKYHCNFATLKSITVEDLREGELCSELTTGSKPSVAITFRITFKFSSPGFRVLWSYVSLGTFLPGSPSHWSPSQKPSAWWGASLTERWDSQVITLHFLWAPWIWSFGSAV